MLKVGLEHSRIRKTVFITMPGSSKDFLDMFTGGQGMGSLAENASMMNKMNGTTDMMGMPSQGTQELAQNVEQNEKTAILQKLLIF